jgi:hypothetical protein
MMLGKGSDQRLHLHAHELLVGFNELVADLDHERKGGGSLLHRDHALMELVGAAEQHLVGDGVRLALTVETSPSSMLPNPSADGLTDGESPGIADGWGKGAPIRSG